MPFDRWLFLFAACAAGAALVALATLIAWLLLQPPLPAPATDGGIYAPVTPSPFTPTPAPPAPAPSGGGIADAAAPTLPAAAGVHFRIMPGATIAEVLRQFAADPRVTHDVAGTRAADLMRHLGLGGHAEGRFLPGSYGIDRTTAASDILREAHDRMRTALDYAWRGRASGLPYATPDEALIVASIVERETARGEDRPRVAAVFTRRMHMGMRLQADPTVIYGLGGRLEGGLARHHLTIDTPYNTYTRDGLPPTPIALPGIASIEAALHPAVGTSLYFVGRGDGTTEFSDTLAEHKAAVRRYRR